MKTTKILTALAMLGMIACNNVNDDVTSKGSALRIKVGTQTKALITETTLPDAAEVGTFLLDGTGQLYDQLPYGNVRFTADGTGASQTWAPDMDVMLSATEGTLYAYYPYSASATDLTAVPVTATSDNQTDYMWAAPAAGLNNKNATATLTMNHAMTAVRLKVTKGNYSGTGIVTATSVQSDALATGANLDITDGTLASVSGVGTTIVPAFSQFTLSASEKVLEFIAVPVDGASKALTIEMIIDGVTLTVEAPAAEYEQGSIAEYSLTVNNTELSLNLIKITEWEATNYGLLEISQVASI